MAFGRLGTQGLEPTSDYTVVANDSLSKIADQFGVTVEELLRLNPEISNRNLIKEDQGLNLPGMTVGDPRMGYLQGRSLSAPVRGKRIGYNPNPDRAGVATIAPTNVQAVSNVPQATSVPPQLTPEMQNILSLQSQEPGYFEQNAPWIMGLLGGASGLLEAMGPSRMPVSGGQIFARGLQSGLSGYLGGSQFQSQARQGRQQQISNLLETEGFKERVLERLQKRQTDKSLGDAIIKSLEGMDRSTLTEPMKRQYDLALTFAKGGNPTQALKIYQTIVPISPSYEALSPGETIVERTGDEVRELFQAPYKSEGDAGAPFPQKRFMTGGTILQNFPALKGSIDVNQNYRPIYDETSGQITNFEVFDLTEDDKILAATPGSIQKGVEVNKATGSQAYVDLRDYIFDEDDGWKPVNEQAFSEESGMRKEFNKFADRYTKAKDSYNAIYSSFRMAMDQPDTRGVADLNIIRSFMLMIEPNSVVRESEFASAAAAQGLIEKLKATGDKIQRGAILSDKARQHFLNAARAYISQTEKSFRPQITRYEDIAKRNNLVASNIVYDPFSEIEGKITLGPFDWGTLNNPELVVNPKSGNSGGLTFSRARKQ